MEAGKRTITDIFNKGRSLEIPFFQRHYVWAEDNWSRLLEDICNISENGSDYFLGSAILKRKDTPTNAQVGDCRTVIDGQQRLTTLVLLFKVVCESNENYSNIFNDIFFNYTGNFILKHNHIDAEIFDAIVNNNLTKQLSKKYNSNNVLMCYLYFKSDSIKNKILSIDLCKVISKLYFVGIDLSPNENEQQIFDTINSLGTRLTTAELLKNYLYDSEDIELYNKTWKHTFENTKDDIKFWDRDINGRANIDIFLQSFLIILKRDNKFRLEDMFLEYKNYIDLSIRNGANKSSFIANLIDYALKFREFFDIDFLGNCIEDTSRYIERLNIIVFKLNNTTIIPYSLFILKNIEDENEKESIFKLLETYILRRIACNSDTKSYNAFFTTIIKKDIKTADALKKYLLAPSVGDESDNSNRMPSNDEVSDSFVSIKLTNIKARSILYLLELSLRHNNMHQNPIYGIDEYDLEHIMPTAWMDNWDIQVDDNEHREQRNIAIRTIGNLTILRKGLNRSIKNASWDIKKLGQNGKKGLNFYCEGLETFSEYLEKTKWDEDEILNRSKELLNNFISVWNI